MPILDSITVRGFKSIAALEIKLRSINVIIGANGAGKSNFIGVFSFLHALRNGGLEDYVAKAGGADKVLHFGAKHTNELYVHVSFEEGKHQYEVALQPTDADELIPKSEKAMFWPKPRQENSIPYADSLSRIGKEAGISDPSLTKVPYYVRGYLDSWRVYHFHDTGAASPMKKTAKIDDNHFLRPDGANLGAFLYLLRERHAGSYAFIRDAVRSVAPFFDDFLLEPQKLNPETMRLNWRHKSSDAFFDAASLSDGTLRFIALATLLLQPQELRPSVILIDEPELGLHPYAINILAALIQQAALETQVVLSTQSSLLLDHFEPQDVLVADRVDGSTKFSRLEAAKLDDWLQDYSLGQLWEKNELGGRPGPA